MVRYSKKLVSGLMPDSGISLALHSAFLRCVGQGRMVRVLDVLHKGRALS